MKTTTFAKLLAHIEDVINEENDDRNGFVYPSLAADMATAARAVYDACLRGQSYARHETEETTRE